MSLLHRARSQIFGSSPKSNPQLFVRSPKGNPVGVPVAAVKGTVGGVAAASGLFPYDVAIFVRDTSLAAERVWGYTSDRVLHFPAGLTASIASCFVAHTGGATYSLQKNGIEVATLTFAAGATGRGIGAWVCPLPFDLAAGDELALISPNPADATGAQIEGTLFGTRPATIEAGTIPGRVGDTGAKGDPGAKGDIGDTGPAGASQQVTTTADGAMTIGAGVYLTAAGAKKGDCTDDAKCVIAGVSTQTVLTGAAFVFTAGGRVAGVLAAATPGDAYFLGSTGLPVLYATVPARARVIQLGFAAENGVDLIVQVRDFGRRA